MAKPIRATPKLTADETHLFLQEMLKKEKQKISAAEREWAEQICKEFGC